MSSNSSPLFQTIQQQNSMSQLTPKKLGFSQQNSFNNLDFHEEAYNIPSSEWVARAMHNHPDILELRERIRPINNTKSYSRNRRSAKTEGSQIITDTVLTKLIMQYLHEENLTATLSKIQEETSIKFIQGESEKESLPTLLRIGIKDVSNGWFGMLEEPNEFDPEVSAYHAYVSDQALSESSDQDTSNIWDDINDESQILKNADGTIQAATLNKLIWWMIINFNSSDFNEFKKIFFLTYPSFTTSETILTKLIQSYHSPTRQNSDFGLVVCFLKLWIDQQPLDFNDKLLSMLNNFIDNQMVKDGFTNWAKQLRTIIASKIENTNDRIRRKDIKDPPEPKVPKNIFSPTLTFDDIDEEEIARQLCIIDFSLYEMIKPSEFLIKGWTKPQFRSKAVNLLNMMRRFNEFTKWVAASLLNEQQIKGRSKLLGRFLKISEHLKNMSNFNSLMAIYGGINNTHVWRTKAIRKDLTKQQQETYTELEKLFHSDNNYKNYRIAYKDAKPPCIPFLGVHLRDLAFVDEGSPDKIDHLINLNKRRTIWRVISNTMKYQPIPYNFLKVHQIQVFLTELKVDVEQTKPLDLTHDIILPSK
eukprot:gene691-852_t